MLNAFELYRQLKEEEIVLAFKGAMTEDLLSSVFQMLEQKKEDDAIEARRIKKLNNILVECLQNIYHHGEDLAGLEGGDNNNAVVFLLCKNSNHKYLNLPLLFQKAHCCLILRDNMFLILRHSCHLLYRFFLSAMPLQQ